MGNEIEYLVPTPPTNVIPSRVVGLKILSIQ